VKRLREQRARWQDPAYVEQRAREHLHFVRPGEIGYIVRDGSGGARRPADRGPDRAWYQNLWDGVDKADRADRADGRDAADKADAADTTNTADEGR
jgi:hypothetical protein